MNVLTLVQIKTVLKLTIFITNADLFRGLDIYSFETLSL